MPAFAAGRACVDLAHALVCAARPHVYVRSRLRGAVRDVPAAFPARERAHSAAPAGRARGRHPRPQQEAEASDQTQAAQQPQLTDEQIYNTIVYSVFNNAENYHTGPTCEGQENGRRLTVRQALDLSLTPCPNCNPPAPSTYYAETGEAQTESQEGQE